MSASSALTSAALQAELARQFPDIDLTRLRVVLALFFWRWYVDHQKDQIVSTKILFFRVTILVRDCFALFLMLFGPNPLPRKGE